MSYEEKLDFILKRLYEERAFYIPEISVCDYLRPHISQSEFREFKHKLIGDGYLQEEIDENSLGAYQASFTIKSYKYRITSKGKYFVDSGETDAGKRHEEKEVSDITKNSYKINKWVLILTIISIVLASIALFK